MPNPPPPTNAMVDDDLPLARERGSSVVEYVGLGALGTMLVSGLVAALDSGAGDRLGAALVRRLIEAIAGS